MGCGGVSVNGMPSPTVLLLLLVFSTFHVQGNIIEGPSNITYLPGVTPLPIELTCNVTGQASWEINNISYRFDQLDAGRLQGHNRTETNILVYSPVNNTKYICVSQVNNNSTLSDPAYIIIAGVPAMVPGVTVDGYTVIANESNVTLTLNWGEPFDNFNPIVNYTVSYSGNGSCPLHLTTTDNTTSYTITNLTTMINYTFSVVATNSVGSGKAGTLNRIFQGSIKDYVTNFKLSCKPVDVHHECNISWNAVSLKNTTLYQVFYYDKMMNISNSSTTFFTFIPQPLLDDVRIGTVSANITAINKCSEVTLDTDYSTETINAPAVDNAVIFVAINLTSFPVILNDTDYTVDIFTNISLVVSCSKEDDPVVRVPNNTFFDNVYVTPSPSNSSDATFLHDVDEASDRYNMTIIASLHNDTGADKVHVIAMPEIGMNLTASGSLIPNSSIAVVSITELECGMNYTIVAGGVMSNGDLAGPRLILGKSPKISCVLNQSNGTDLPDADDDDELVFILIPIIILFLIAIIAGGCATFIYIWKPEKTCIRAVMWILFVASLGFGLLFLGIYLFCYRREDKNLNGVKPNEVVEMKESTDPYASPKKKEDENKQQEPYSYSRTGPINIIVPGGKP